MTETFKPTKENKSMKQGKPLAAAFMAIALAASACNGGNSGAAPAKTAEQKSEEKVANRENYSPDNDVEGDNYNNRQKISDDPSTIQWCTVALSDAPSAPLITVPIAGKLTSGNKRPYSTEEIVQKGGIDNRSYVVVEKAGPDGMFGSSNQYLYGFTPAGDYWQFNGQLPTCTTEPTVYQREQTEIVVENDAPLTAAAEKAEQLLKDGKPAEAQKVLIDAAAAGQLDEGVEDE